MAWKEKLIMHFQTTYQNNIILIVLRVSHEKGLFLEVHGQQPLLYGVSKLSYLPTT